MFRRIRNNSTPSAASTVPIPVTKLDWILDSPGPRLPYLSEACRVLFPGSPVRRIVYPPARPYTGSLDALSSPMSDISTDCSPSSDACQVLPQLPMPRLNVTFRVFYRPDELSPDRTLSPGSLVPESTTRCPTEEHMFASAARSILDASGLPLAGLNSVNGLKDVIGVLTRFLSEYFQPCGDDIPAGLPCLSVEDTSQDRSITVSPKSFSLDTKAFTSYSLLSNPGRKATLHDQLESLVWIFLYIVLRYSKHNVIKGSDKLMKPLELRTPRTPVRTKNKPNLHALLTLLFGQNTLAEEEYGVGFAKLALFLTHRPLPQNFEVFDNPPITSAVFALIELFEGRYKFLERILPKKVRTLASELNISYEDAEVHYKATDSYKRRMEKIDMLPQRMETIFRDCLSNEGWSDEDILVDGLAPSNLERAGY